MTTQTSAPEAGAEQAPAPVAAPEITQADINSLGRKLQEWMVTLTPAEQVLLAGIIAQAAPPAVPTPSRLPLLEVTDGPATGQTLLFGSPSLTIGRKEGNDLVITDRAVSGQHAQIERLDDGSFWLVDLQSTNGTLFNGLRVDQPVELHDGDLIRIGGTELRFAVAVEQPA